MAAVGESEERGELALVFYKSSPPALCAYVKSLIESLQLHVREESLLNADSDDGNKTPAGEEDDGKAFGCALIITATEEANAKRAERICLGKRTVDGDSVPFRLKQRDSFVTSANGELFSGAEKIMLTWQLLQELRADPERLEDVDMPSNAAAGEESRGETLIAWLQRNGHARPPFPLHEERQVRRILSQLSVTRPWLSDAQLDELCAYFGDRVALYFGFVSTYTSCLVVYAVVGVLAFALSFVPKLRPWAALAVGLFSTFWSTWMLQRWRKRNIDLIYSWRGIILGDGTDERIFERTLVEDMRDNFVGQRCTDDITGEVRPFSTKDERRRRRRVSAIGISGIFALSMLAIFLVFHLEDRINAFLADEDDEYVFYKEFPFSLLIQNVPVMAFFVTVMLLDQLFNAVARALTEYENHMLHREYAYNLTDKLTSFQFLNVFGAFLYIAFIRRDAEMLTQRVANLFVIELVTGNIKETIMPIVFRAFRQLQVRNADVLVKKDGAMEPPPSKLKMYTSRAFLKELWAESISQITVTQQQLAMPVRQMTVHEQLMLEDSEGDVDDDYFELYRQLGYVTLFAVTFPLGPAFALGNNCAEIYADFLKFVRNQKRPVPAREISMGVWGTAMYNLSMLSALSNLLLVFHTAPYGAAIFPVSMPFLYLIMVSLQQAAMTIRNSYLNTSGKTPDHIRNHRARLVYETIRGKND